jgi:hypothetical protein
VNPYLTLSKVDSVISGRALIRRAPSFAVAYIDQEADIYKRVEPLISASRGTLAGDLFWAVGFILAIMLG